MGLVGVVGTGIVAALVLALMHSRQKLAVFSYQFMELSLLLLCLLLVIVAFIKMRPLGYLCCMAQF